MSDFDLDLDELLGETSKTKEKAPKNGTPSSSGKKRRKKRVVNKYNPKMKRVTGGRVFLSICTGVMSSAVLAVMSLGVYTKYIKYPEEISVDDDETGLNALNWFSMSVANLDSTGEDSYIHQEIAYANGDEDKLNFYKKVAGTVSYTPVVTRDMNVLGYKLIDTDNNQGYRDSTVGVGEPVLTTYIDYSRVKIDRDKISDLMTKAKLRVGDVDYPNKLVDVFCQYIGSLKDDEIPLRTVYRVPDLNGYAGNYCVGNLEDIYLDRVLFSSDELRNLMERFSAVASSVGVENPAWSEWNNSQDKENKEEPAKEIQIIEPTKEWKDWDSLSVDEKAMQSIPDKYNWKELMSDKWCGTYYLQNEYSEEDDQGNDVKKAISAEVGDGTLENPAGLNTDVVTYVLSDEDGKLVKYPISVRMTDFGVSEDAIKWIESKDVRNRGIDVSSEVQYYYCTFSITNMSDKTITVNDNSCISDASANCGSRTGIIYGLQDSITLNPDETGTIESWGRSTELNLRYLIWGKDFARREKPVWFRVLAGDIDDPSEDKGVTINKSRYDDDTDDNSDVNSDSSTTSSNSY